MLEMNKIHCMDCIEGMKQLPNDYVDITITSPPYNVGKNNMTQGKYINDEDSMSSQEYEDFLSNSISEMIRITKHYVFFNIALSSGNKIALLNLMGKFSNQIKDIVIWKKDVPIPCIEPGVLSRGYEFVIVFSKERPELRKFDYCFFGQGKLVDVISGLGASSDKQNMNHSAMFPRYFVRWFIKNFSKENDIIFDPFSGAGTTAKVAKELSRRWLGFEIDANYVNQSNHRLAQEVLNL